MPSSPARARGCGGMEAARVLRRNSEEPLQLAQVSFKPGRAGINCKGAWQHRDCGLCGLTRGAVLRASSRHGQDLPQESNSRITIYVYFYRKNKSAVLMHSSFCMALQRAHRALSVARAELNSTREGSLFRLGRSVVTGWLLQHPSTGTKIHRRAQGERRRGGSVCPRRCWAASEAAGRFHGRAGS